MNIGREHLEYAVRAKNQIERRFEALRGRLKGSTKKVVGTLEVASAALAGGVIQGHAGKEGSTVMGCPTDLGLGILLNIAGYFKAAGDYSEHLNNFGDGFLASFTSSVGFGWGNNWRETGKFQLTSKPGDDRFLPGSVAPTTASGEISPAQMADIVARVRASAHG